MFAQLGQEYNCYAPKGTPREARRRLRPGEWCWVERKPDESGLCPLGEVVTIEEAIQLSDADGNDIPGGLERLTLWETLAKRRGLPVPKQRVRRKPKQRRKKAS